jgi:biopolymer transport protein ExbD
MKTQALYLPLFFILIFVIFALAHAVSEHGSAGFLVEVSSLEQSCKTETLLYHDPLTVRVLSENHLELNKEKLNAAELRLRLEQIYSLRGERAVFVDAEPDVEVRQVIAVLDLVNQTSQDIHVKLITPRNRKDICPDVPMLSQYLNGR